MNTRKHWPLYLLLTAVAVLGTRAAWRLASSEMGWTPHLNQWAKVAASFVGIERRELSDRDPAGQANFWLNEVKRIGSVTDPQTALGAAWMLDAPQFGFIRRYVRMKEGYDLPGLSGRWRRELDEEAIAAVTEEYERLCRQTCLATIEIAVRLDDADVELRRARAQLLFPPTFMYLDSEPRQGDWLSLLAECSQADPDNALYDYLAALRLWTSSAHYDWEQEGYVLTVDDQVRFDEGNTRLAAGLGKPHLRFGRQGYAATLAFLAETSLSRPDYLHAAGSRQIDTRAADLLYQIMRWENVRSDVAKRAGRVHEARDAARRVLAISAQVTEDGNSPNLLTPKWLLRQWSLATLHDLNRDHPHLRTADEAEHVAEELADVQRQLKVLEEVGRKMAARAGESVSDLSLATTATVQRKLLPVFVMAAAQMLAIVCVVLALMSSLLTVPFRRNTDGHRVTLGWGRHIVAWLFAVVLSFVLLGLLPAKVVPMTVQPALVCSTIWGSFGAMFLGLLCLVGRRFRLPTAQLAVLAMVTSLPLITLVHAARFYDLAVAGAANLHPTFVIVFVLSLAVICCVTVYTLRYFTQNPHLACRRKLLAVGVVFLMASVAVPAGTALGMFTHAIGADASRSPTVWREAQCRHMEAEELQQAMTITDSRWAWAFIQWHAYHGPLVAPIILVIIVAVWHLLRRVGQADGGLRQVFRSYKKCALSHTGQSIASSCLVASLAFLAVYLCTLPSVADMMDTYYRVHYTRMARPAKAWEELAQLTVEVRSDQDTMTRLQAEIDQRNRQLQSTRGQE